MSKAANNGNGNFPDSEGFIMKGNEQQPKGVRLQVKKGRKPSHAATG